MNGEYASIFINEDGNDGSGSSIYSNLCEVSCIFELKSGQYLVAHGCNIYDINYDFKAPMEGDAYLPGMFQVGKRNGYFFSEKWPVS